MKTQISRDSFEPGQRYSGVYLQQGRMILDADWNELTDIEKARVVAALRDAIAGGAPRAGGLVVEAQPAGSSNVVIRPGTLYVDGVPARLDTANPTAINQQPDYPIGADYTGTSLKLYADVWERSVTAVERQDLMDAALHGADTATRSQTMLQIKWCPDTIDPQSEAVNPRKGNAALTLRLRLIASGGDPCDPCASQVRVNERLGNYLFRVEVHDYDPTNQWLTLKWSRDNGAEACPVGAMPNGFNQGAWVWEYFDDDTERLLGNHFVSNPKKQRGLIKDTCATPTGVNEPKQYVRQWDGYIRIKLDTGILSGRDRGVALASGPDSSQAHGRVNLAGGFLKINLELMELTLTTAGGRYVPGDYWVAEVRENRHVSGDIVLNAAPPIGVLHHYLFLGAIGINQKLVATDDGFRRQMAFPPLTDLRAADVGFTDNCPGLFAGAKNLQAALDSLCGIDAGDIAYPLPNCGTNEGKSIKDKLKALLDPDSDGRLTVKAALDNLLCQLDAASLPYAMPACASSPNLRERLGLAAGNSYVATVLDALLCQFKANHLPLDKSDPDLCSDLQVPGAVTVQDALKILCSKSGSGCVVPVTSPEHLQVLLNDFADHEDTDLWLCLKPGTYPLRNLPRAIDGKRSLRICGEGPESVRIAFSGDVLRIKVDELLLENLTFAFAKSEGQLVIESAECQVRSCSITRTGTVSGPPMISVAGRENAPCRIVWRDNYLQAQVKRPSTAGGSKWASPEVVGNPQLSTALLHLGSEELLANKAAYDDAVVELARQMVTLPKDERAGWKARLDHIAIPRAPARRPKVGTAATMSEALAADTLTFNQARLAVEDLVALWVTTEPDYALRLESAKVGGTLADNQIDGWLLLGNGIAGEHNPDSGVTGTTLDTNIKSSGEDLHFESNDVTAIKANLPEGAVNAKGMLTRQVTGHSRLFLVSNSIAEIENTLLAASFIAQGNTWRSTARKSPGSVLADRATFIGNLLEGSEEADPLTSTVKSAALASTGNVLVELKPSI